MGNTDILTTSLPDADTENTTEHSTIFDDVFRTIAQIRYIQFETWTG